MKIGLFGFTFGHENMGCQALTCAFLEMMEKLFPDEHFDVVTFHTGTSFGEIPKLFPKMNFSSCRVKIKTINPEFLKVIKSCDFVFDETYGDGFSDIYFGNRMYISILVKLYAASTKTPYILTPQTYGPFYRKGIEFLAARVIKRANYVFARDKISADCAEKISGRTVKTVTDLAFALPYDKPEKANDQKRIGLNISGLLWQGGFDGKDNQFGLKTDYQQYCKMIIEYGLRQGYEVHVIPHVTKSADEDREIPDGDYPACCEIKRLYEKVVLAPCFSTPYDAKNYIATMDFFIGARMHATIGAFSSGVVTIPFAYSRKFQGLYDNLGYPYYIDGTKVDTEEAFDLTRKFIMDSEVLSKKQAEAMIIVQRKLDEFKSDLRTIMTK